MQGVSCSEGRVAWPALAHLQQAIQLCVQVLVACLPACLLACSKCCDWQSCLPVADWLSLMRQAVAEGVHMHCLCSDNGPRGFQHREVWDSQLVASILL